MSQLECKKTHYANFTCHKNTFHILGYIHDYRTIQPSNSETFHNNTHKKTPKRRLYYVFNYDKLTTLRHLRTIGGNTPHKFHSVDKVRHNFVYIIELPIRDPQQVDSHKVAEVVLECV